jgi:hypothetical protein
MELIPILSTIILVATISTFLLAIGAYILYKIREGRARQYQEKNNEQLKAELLTPTKLHDQKLYGEEVVEHTQRMNTEERYKIEVPRNRFERQPVGHNINKTSDVVPNGTKEYEVQVPETRFKKFSNGNSSKHSDDEVNQGEILWR